MVENYLLRTGAVANIDFLPVGVYAAAYNCVSEAEVLSYTAEMLRSQGNFVVVINSSTHTNGSTAENITKAGTSAVVDSIEKELGVDLDVSSDAELHSILQKNGAGPLSELLKMAYGTKKQKVETQK